MSNQNSANSSMQDFELIWILPVWQNKQGNEQHKKQQSRLAAAC
jgi:hypothetical protein